MEKSFKKLARKLQFCTPQAPFNNPPQNNVYEEVRVKLVEVLESLMRQKEEYEVEVNEAFSRLAAEYSCKINEKDKAILQLQNKISSLIDNSKQIQNDYQIRLKEKEDEISMLRLLLKKKYVRELALEQKLKTMAADQNKQIARKSQENISTYLSPRKAEDNMKKRGSCLYNKVDTERDLQTMQTRQSTIKGNTRDSAIYLTCNKPKNPLKSSLYSYTNMQKNCSDSKLKLVKSSIFDMQLQY